MSFLTTKNTLRRDEIPAEFKWHLADIYPSTTEWEADYRKLKGDISEVFKLHPGFLNSAGNLLAMLQLRDNMGRRLDKLFVYAKMQKDGNNADPAYQALTDRIQSLGTEVGSSLSFIVPELAALDQQKLEVFIKEAPDLELYRHLFKEIAREKQHILSTPEEKILAESSEVTDAAGAIFGMLDNADFRFPTITDENGETVELTKGRYSRFIESRDRRVREDAFKALYSTYSKFRNTLGSTLNYSVKSDVFFAKVRKFESALQSSLDGDNIPITVYERLIETVHSFLPSLQRYLKLRKKILSLNDLHLYDLYTPLIPEYQRTIEYSEAKEIVLAGLSPLGGEYLDLIRKGYAEGWIDVYENEGKTSGAYAWGAYDTHPYVLLNYQGKIHDVFTIAHEMGHALHSFYSNHNQPYVYAGYKIFLAEVASTVNEALLMEYLIGNSKDPKEKQYLINQYLEQFRTTVIRQTMFAEFERMIHQEVENGGALTSEWFSQQYLDLNKSYYSPEVVIDPEIAMEWSRIPHFYSAYYVYKYATGYSAAVALSQQILTEGEPARARYLQFLKSGDSDYPLTILRRAGVDMESPAPIKAALQVFDKLLSELAELTGISI